jgi:hypothetical protein
MQGVKLGFFSLAAAVAATMAGCSDPENTPNGNGGTSNGGSAGTNTAGAAGTGMAGDGMGGTASGNGGNAGAGGSPGTGGTAQGGTGNVPDAGPEAPCTGCVELRVPVTGGANQTTLFQFFIASGPVDFSNATITFRMRALTIGDQLVGVVFAQDGDFGGFGQQFGFLNAAAGFVDTETWVNRTFDLSALAPPATLPVDADAGADAGPAVVDPAAFNQGQVRQYGVQIGAFAGQVGAETVTVLVDSVTFTGLDANAFPTVTFDTGVDGLAINGSGPVAGSEIIHHPAE